MSNNVEMTLKTAKCRRKYGIEMGQDKHPFMYLEYIGSKHVSQVKFISYYNSKGLNNIKVVQRSSK